MFCPRCGYPQKCSCDGPICGYKDGQIHVGKDMCKCFKCGLTRHLDWWSDLECEIYKEEGKRLNNYSAR